MKKRLRIFPGVLLAAVIFVSSSACSGNYGRVSKSPENRATDSKSASLEEKGVPNTLSIYGGTTVPGFSAGVSSGIPATKAVKNVITDFGAAGDGTTDDAAAFQKAIDAAAEMGGGAVYVPAGTYYLKSQLVINKDGVVLKGEGTDKTHLNFDCNTDGIMIRATTNPFPIPASCYVDVKSGYTQGSTTLELADASTFNVGDYCQFQEENDPEVMYTKQEWNVDYAQRVRGQVFGIVAKSGNAITISDPITRDYDAKWKPNIRKIDVVKNVGLEDMHITRTDQSDTALVTIWFTSNGWVKNCDIDKFSKVGVQISIAHRIEIRDSYIHDATRFDGGGHGYCIQMQYNASNCLIENNVFRKFRHAVLTTLGSVGNIIAYNYAREAQSEQSVWQPPNINMHGFYCNNNLVESNVVDEIDIGDYWGPTPNNTFLRNRVKTRGIDIMDHSNNINIIGSEIMNSRTVNIDPTVDPSTCIIHGNVQNGSVVWDPKISDHTVPNSYYLTSKPAFFGNKQWPAIGPDVNGKNTIPAEDRWNTLISPPPPMAAKPYSIIDEGMDKNWADQSWGCKSDFNNASSVYSGNKSVSIALDMYSGFSLRNEAEAVNTGSYTNLEFYINGGEKGGQKLEFWLFDGVMAGQIVTLDKYVLGGSIPANKWVKVSIPLSDLVWENMLLKEVNIKNPSTSKLPAFYIDKLQLIASKGGNMPIFAVLSYFAAFCVLAGLIILLYRWHGIRAGKQRIER